MGNRVVLELCFWENDEGKESKLHSLRHADNSHQDKQDNHRHIRRQTSPHAGLSIEEGNKDHSHAEAEDDDRGDGVGPEEEVLREGSFDSIGLPTDVSGLW